MAWVVPRTWITGEIVTAAMLNGVRDALNDLDRRTVPVSSLVTTQENTTSTNYIDLATVGPAVTVSIGSIGRALVSIYCWTTSTVAGVQTRMAYGISGATTRAAGTSISIGWNLPNANNYLATGGSILETGLSPGTTTFTAKYSVAPPGGQAGYWQDRRIVVQPLGS